MKRSFSLLELIITIFLASLIISVFAILLDYSIKTNDYIINDKSSQEEANYIFNYLSNEIMASDRVYSSNRKNIKAGYEDGLGIILRQAISDNDNSVKEYKYIYFSLKNGQLYRIATSTREDNINSNKINFNSLYRDGVNSIADGIEAIESNYNEETNLLKVSMKFKDNKTYSSSIYCYGGVD